MDFYDHDANAEGELDCLLFSAVIDCDLETGEWYAVIDQESFCHESDLANPSN